MSSGGGVILPQLVTTSPALVMSNPGSRHHYSGTGGSVASAGGGAGSRSSATYRLGARPESETGSHSNMIQQQQMSQKSNSYRNLTQSPVPLPAVPNMKGDAFIKSYALLFIQN